MRPGLKSYFIFLMTIMLSISLISCKKKETVLEAQPVSVLNVPYTPVDVRVEVAGIISTDYLPQIKAQVARPVEKVLVKVGQSVKKDDALIVLDDSYEKIKLKEAIANWRSAKANFNSAEKEYEMKEKLAKSGTIAKLTLIQAESQMNVAKQNWLASNENLNSAKQALEETTIRAPINGRIAGIDVSVGSHPQIGDKLITLSNNNQVTAVFPLAQSKIKNIKLGQKVDLSSDPSKQYEIFSTITNIEPNVDPESGLFNLLVTFSNKLNWQIGSSVYGNIIINTVPEALVVPDTAVILRAKGNVIYVIYNNTAYEVPVTIVMRDKNRIAVTADIKPNLDIAVQGAAYLHDGSKVRIEKETIEKPISDMHVDATDDESIDNNTDNKKVK